MRAQADHPLLVGAVVVIYRRNTYQQHGEYNLLQNAEFKANLRDGYLTSAVRTKEGDKAGSSQPPARDPVQFKLELTPNYLISYLDNARYRSTGYVSLPHPNESSILPKFRF